MFSLYYYYNLFQVYLLVTVLVGHINGYLWHLSQSPQRAHMYEWWKMAPKLEAGCWHLTERGHSPIHPYICGVLQSMCHFGEAKWCQIGWWFYSSNSTWSSPWVQAEDVQHHLHHPPITWVCQRIQHPHFPGNDNNPCSSRLWCVTWESADIEPNRDYLGTLPSQTIEEAPVYMASTTIANIWNPIGSHTHLAKFSAMARALKEWGGHKKKA